MRQRPFILLGALLLTTVLAACGNTPAPTDPAAIPTVTGLPAQPPIAPTTSPLPEGYPAQPDTMVTATALPEGYPAPATPEPLLPEGYPANGTVTPVP